MTPSDAPAGTRRTVAEINAQVRREVRAERPRRQNAILAVQNAVRATQTPRQQQDNAQRAILRAQEQDAIEAAIEVALEREATAQANCFPTTLDAWRAHVISGVAMSVEYFHSRVNIEGGDRYALGEFYRGARIFDPFYAASIDHDEGLALIDKMRHYHILNVGNASIIVRLKGGWRAYRVNACRVVKEFDYSKDKAAILSWQYQLFLRQDVENATDLSRRKCRYCNNRSRNCTCNGNLRVWWWEAAQLAALVMPSSGAAERVFSLVNNMFSDQRSKILTDAIFLSLYLSYNKRNYF